MKIIKKIFNRYNILSYILVFLITVLSFRLATLTIAQGDYYRDISDNKRVKEVYVTAPRGEIRDRYGRLLAGNLPSFTVQLLKDELNIEDKKVKNHGVLTLMRLLEEDGVSYLDEYPVELNIFKYTSESYYLEENYSPIDKVIEIIIENNLLPEILNSYYMHPEYKEHYDFIIVNRVINSLKRKGMTVPIDSKISEDGLDVFFDETQNINKWKENYDISKDLSPIQSLVELVKDDRTIIRKAIDHPLSRLLVYYILEEKRLTGNIMLEEFSIKFREDYLKQKILLTKTYPKINMSSSAKEDFVNIFTEVSLKNFLERVIISEENGKEKIIVPGQVLLDVLKSKGQNLPVAVQINEDKNGVIYTYVGGNDIGDENPVDILINQANEANLLKTFISIEEIKSYAQEQLLIDGVNPKISIAKDFEYVDINNLNKWYSENKIDDSKTIKEAFGIIRDNNKIDPKLSKYEVRSMLVVYNQLSKQGHLAYQPINIAYGIKDSTVARIEEGLMEYPGITISVEPVRYYPEGTTAAHILGYLGKISQAKEIQTYVEEMEYSPNAIIGKTGIEESYESILSGVNGIKKIEVDVVGNTTKVLNVEKPIPGDTVYLSVDLRLQKKAEEALAQTLEKLSKGGTYESPWGDFKFDIHKRKMRPYINATSGAVVAIDVKTGQVIAMASSNPYDPNLFSTGISTTDWESLFPVDEKDPLAPRPLLNIATQTSVQPGSTFKMVTGLTALEKGMDPNKKIRDMGYVEFGTSRFNCLLYSTNRGSHGYVNVYEALRDSCNYYFYSLAIGKNQRTNEPIGVKIEIEDIVEISKKLGLNDKTGIEINVPAEAAGGVPNPQRKIINTKYLLKINLQRDIEKYVKKDVVLQQEDFDYIIEEIVSWTQLEETLTRNEVIRRLTAMGLDAEKKLPGTRAGLGDLVKYTYLNQVGWNLADTLNTTIGQGYNSYTPIQMANYIATIANGGYKHTLTLVDNIKNYNNSKTDYKHEVNPERIELNNYENLEYIKKGMSMVSSDGTARKTFAKFPIDVASKTGTAERSGINSSTGDTFDDFAWFVGFAPYDEPEIAIAAVIFQGGNGGYAAPMVRDIIAEYLGLNQTEIKENLPYENVLINE